MRSRTRQSRSIQSRGDLLRASLSLFLLVLLLLVVAGCNAKDVTPHDWPDFSFYDNVLFKRGVCIAALMSMALGVYYGYNLGNDEGKSGDGCIAVLLLMLLGPVLAAATITFVALFVMLVVYLGSYGFGARGVYLQFTFLCFCLMALLTAIGLGLFGSGLAKLFRVPDLSHKFRGTSKKIFAILGLVFSGIGFALQVRDIYSLVAGP